MEKNVQIPLLKVSILRSFRDNYPENKSVDYHELEEFLTTFDHCPKKEARGIISGNFNFGKRITQNLHSKSLIFLDIDKYNQPIDSLEKLIKQELGIYQFIAYSTASHIPEKARIRITLFLENEISESCMEDFKTIAFNFIQNLSNELKNSIDVISSITPNHFMYLPIIPHDKYIKWSYVNKGKCVANKEFLCRSVIQYKGYDPLLAVTRNTALALSECDIIAYLQSYPSCNCDYHAWIEVGQALHHQFQGDEAGFKLWDKWSKADQREKQYKGKNFNKAKWDSFSLNRDNPLTFATIIYKAKDKASSTIQSSYSPLNPLIWPHVQRSGKYVRPLFTEENCIVLFREYKIEIKYDVIRKENIIFFDGKKGNGGNDDLTRLKLLFKLNQFDLLLLPETVDHIARKNKFNSWKEWINNKAWDGKDRFTELCETIQVSKDHIQIRNIYLKRWLIQMLHMTCFNDELDPKHGRMVLLFQGKQFIGKSSWLNSLVPENMKEYIQIGTSLNSSNDMDILNCIKKVFVELGEITSTFRKTDMENLKNFISKPEDFINRKYRAEHEIHRRRTVFFGTTNESNFLSDSSGNSRFLVLPVLKCDAKHRIDMQQLYAQLLIEAIQIDNYNLLAEEFILQTKYNEEFTSISALEEKFVEMFDIEDKNCKTVYTATKVLEELGFNIAQMNNKKRTTNEMGTILNKYNFKKSSAPRGWYLPPKRINNFEF